MIRSMSPLRRPRSRPTALAAVVAAGALVLAGLWAWGPFGSTPPAVLVVGDSLVVAAHAALADEDPSGAQVAELAGIGASPCDLWAGYRQPALLGGQAMSYRAVVRSRRPAAVVLAFTGNPGFTSTGCVPDGSGPYRLDQLVSAYRAALTAMGRMASDLGARVYLSAVPPRNPAVPEGWDGSTQRGYNGDPALNTMLEKLASAEGWIYDTTAARALSGPDGGWTLYLPCLPGEAGCSQGRVQVRVGGTDTIHCDDPGTNGPASPSAGSLRYARGLLTRPLRDLARPVPAGPAASSLSCASS